MITVKLTNEQHSRIMEWIDFDLESRQDDLSEADNDKDITPDEILGIKREIADLRALHNVFVFSVIGQDNEDFVTDSEF